MTGRSELAIGCEVLLADDSSGGHLARLVIDPLARTVTHLVVESHGGPLSGRLVPVGLVVETGPPLRLSCDAEDFERLEEAEERKFLPLEGDEWGEGSAEMLSWPYFGLGGTSIGWMGLGALGAAGVEAGAPRSVVYDRVPPGEVAIRRGEPVHALDGPIGRVRGLVVESASCVTHVLLDEGHLWGHKRVAIPLSAVTSVTDGVHVALSKEDVRNLPPVDLAAEQGS
jgi:hypothetical protein